MKLSEFLNEWVPGIAPGDERIKTFAKNKDGSLVNTTATGAMSNEYEERVIKKQYPAFYKKRVPGIYNIGGGEKNIISLVECIDLIAEVLGKKPKVNFCESRFGDLQYFVCDIKKAKDNLGWEPGVRPKEGVQQLINWVKENQNLFMVRK